MKYYTGNDSEHCYPLSYFKDSIKCGDYKEIVLEEQKREVHGEMYCTIYGEYVESRDCCGKQCNNYAPRNGKSGCCKSLTNGFIGTGKKYILTKDGLKSENNPTREG